ncbi:TPA: leu operon leader peptide, partial [Escherichia coli]
LNASSLRGRRVSGIQH